MEDLLKAIMNDVPREVVVGMARGIRDSIIKIRPKPDVVIGGADRPYNLRWWVVPRNKYPFNVYLHNFIRSDSDAALHDHPWANLSILIDGSYIEETAADPKNPAGQRVRIMRRAGDIVHRPDPKFAHRVELLPADYSAISDPDYGVVYAKDVPEQPVWTLFLTGPKVREWGFHCPEGWIDWQTFTGQDESDGLVRIYNDVRGCGET